MDNQQFRQLVSMLREQIQQGGFPAESRLALDEQLHRIEQRHEDDHLYIGIIGEFSSGKSTLINALIGTDFFVMNATQGTTTTPTFIKYGTRVDLTIHFKDGRQQSYSSHKRQLVQRYLPQEYDNMSAWQKMTVAAKGLFGSNRHDATLQQLFDVVTTSDEVAEMVDDVTLQYPADILQGGLVIVDTPGADSLNPKHNAITQHTIAEKCDMAFVIIPAEKPVSMTLANFIDDNITPEDKQKYYFLITKVELLKKNVERIALLKGNRQRITAMMDIDEPRAIMAPTLLSLEERAIISPTGLLSHISEDDRQALQAQFDADIQNIIREIAGSKEQAIDDKLQRLVHQLIASLTQTIDDKKASLQHELELLQTLRTIPLSTFMNNFFADYGISEEYSFTEAKAQNSWNDQCQTFTSYVINRIEAAPTKDEAQKIMKYPEVQKQGQVSFSQCYDTFAHSVNHMRDYYEQLFEDFKQSFTNTFSIDAVDFLFQVRMKESWQRDYKLNFKKSGITTNFFLRWWKELPEIKEEMKTAVRPQISKSYRAIADYYSDKLQHINATLVGQLEQVKEVFIKKYSKTIQQRIVEEEAKMHDLENEIAKMETSLSTLSNPTFTDFSR